MMAKNKQVKNQNEELDFSFKSGEVECKVGANHESKRECANNRQRNGDRRELKGSNMPNEYVGCRIYPVLTQHGESNWSCNLPQLHRLNPNHRLHLLEVLHRVIVPLGGGVISVEKWPGRRLLHDWADRDCTRHRTVNAGL
uniref:Uncharacterized protein MANES_14G023600 n=2 Tax=Rhizophora mucronata TaxID=61149 RepID=A0A2P2J2E1_RHIMU